MAPPASEKKKRRTLVVIDGDALQDGKRYDFSFLEKEKRLEIWFFYKERIHHSFRLRREFSAHNVLLPRYEEDLHLYIIKRVCYELGRREGRYKKVLFIGAHHPVWEGLVQFLRERDLHCTHILAEDYAVESFSIPTSPALEEREPFSKGAAPVKPGGGAPSEKHSTDKKDEEFSEYPPSVVPFLKKIFKRRRKDNAEHVPIYANVIHHLQTYPPGTELSLVQFRKMLAALHISKNDLPAKSYPYFLRRLIEAGVCSRAGKKIRIFA